MGFSLGSFLLWDYLSCYEDQINGAAILGTGQQPGAVLSVLMQIVKRETKAHGFDNPTPLADKLSFENYNRKFAPNKTLPVLLLSGAQDPVGDFGKGIRKLKNSMDRAGLKDVEAHLIQAARHDLFHEEKSGGAKEATDILLEWILRKQ